MSENQETEIVHLVKKIEQEVTQPVHLLSACSGYQVTLQKYGLEPLLPELLRIHHATGCPACLLGPDFIDKLIAYSQRNNVIIATYNDLLGIPGSQASLEKARTAGADIRVVSNIWDMLLLAKKNRRKRIVFPAIGFESAASSTAAAILQAKVAGIFNFQVLTGHRRLPACMEKILQKKDFPVHGVLTSARVAASMGSHYFSSLSQNYQIPQVISSYEPEILLQAILSLVKQINRQTTEIENFFPEAVSEKGNIKSHQLLDEVFEITAGDCTGLGTVKDSTFRIKNEYRMFDAEKVFFDVQLPDPAIAEGCICGEIISGNKKPQACKHFRKDCHPVQALDTCMHAEEGPCRVEYLFGEK
ncbi:hydrogenase formation protein HypD [Candidatus Sulfidibacterium hydrothermale]|uniref:hydrogenase formation protein HypD n=1 Tax=Candidatus Sulfidibacterium hydrothermale TaxID=2875962 RepID=UPI001F0AD61D|nr:hydrogenase formation protein HypD [Candidatus Sulfidibacterium hydrothermale]UBM63240.1 hydrogenase formation protein HypD [Candidatus Sulfidibacterium hydrothermale]